MAVDECEGPSIVKLGSALIGEIQKTRQSSLTGFRLQDQTKGPRKKPFKCFIADCYLFDSGIHKQAPLVVRLAIS